ncbi:T17H7.16 [Arabidopsis thaliana]|uniref:T17H7.16 n=2 Tax=Arabidopsis thaliana TaxID=3702 RepID=Q9SY30_ARATH|nr:T17H7.16 [Arabidopsis thaliana]
MGHKPINKFVFLFFLDCSSDFNFSSLFLLLLQFSDLIALKIVKLQKRKRKLRRSKVKSMADAHLKQRGYISAVAAGLNAALAAISAKFFTSLVIKYGLVVICNVVMWACYVNSLRALSSLQATVTNFAANFLSSGLAGLFLFQESLSFRWFAGALSITTGVLILSKSSVDKKVSSD